MGQALEHCAESATMSGRFSRKRRRKQMNAQREKAMGSMHDTIKHLEAMIAELKAHNETKKDES